MPRTPVPRARGPNAIFSNLSVMFDGRLAIRLPADLASAFSAAAEVEGLSRSEATRRAVVAYVESVALEDDERPGEPGAVKPPVEEAEGVGAG
jgi:hypothetical protein